MTTRKTLKIFAITVATFGTALAPTAYAASSDEVRVEIDSRYLETDWGVEKVYKTLSKKAESACTFGSTGTLHARMTKRDCMSDLLDDFIESADHERLTTYHTIATNY